MLVALLTDFGLADTYVGVMHAIIAQLAPGVPVVDLTHAIPPQDVTAAAWHLAVAAPYLGSDAVVCAVVDPGVGTTRRAIAVQIGSHAFVAPDNGLLTRVLARGPVGAAVVLDDPAAWLDRAELPVSGTFHGRDIFAPVAARLAHGMPLRDLGRLIDPASLVRLPLAVPTRLGDRVTAHVVHIDHFGNVITDLGPEFTAAVFGTSLVNARLGRHAITKWAATFGQGPAGEPFWYPDSSGYAAIASQNGSAAARLGVHVGDVIILTLPKVTP